MKTFKSISTILLSMVMIATEGIRYTETEGIKHLILLIIWSVLFGGLITESIYTDQN